MGWLTILPLLSLLSFGYSSKCLKEDAAPGREILCYSSSYELDQFRESVCRCTTIVHEGHDLKDFSSTSIEELKKSLKEINPAIQFVLSLNDAKNMLKTSATSRQDVIARLVANINKVDGYELNVTAGSKERLVHFIQGLKNEIVRNGKDKKIFLSLPTRSEDLAKQFNIKELSKYVDLFTIPTHYLMDDEEKYNTFHPSRLMGLFDLLNTDSLVDLVHGLGADKSKIIISLPTGGYKFTLKDKDQTIPRAPAETEIPTLISRAQLCQDISVGEWIVERDEDLTAPYAFKNRTWIAFEDETSAGIKGKYVILRNLGGLAVRNIENDIPTDCGKSITHQVYQSFTDNKRKTREAVLTSLEDDIYNTDNLYGGNLKQSDFRISRIVDTEGKIHAVREDTQTKFSCPHQGYFVHPKSCNRFYRCVKFNQEIEDYSIFEFDCPADLVFDEGTEVCVWPGSLSKGSACPGSSEIAPSNPRRFECPHEGYYADPKNCRFFFACMHLGGGKMTAYEFQCPYGLVFDESKLVCEWPWLVPSCAGRGYEHGNSEPGSHSYGGHEEQPGHEVHMGGGDHGIYHGGDENGYDHKIPSGGGGYDYEHKIPEGEDGKHHETGGYDYDHKIPEDDDKKHHGGGGYDYNHKIPNGEDEKHHETGGYDYNHKIPEGEDEKHHGSGGYDYDHKIPGGNDEKHHGVGGYDYGHKTPTGEDGKYPETGGHDYNHKIPEDGEKHHGGGGYDHGHKTPTGEDEKHHGGGGYDYDHKIPTGEDGKYPETGEHDYNHKIPGGEDEKHHGGGGYDYDHKIPGGNDEKPHGSGGYDYDHKIPEGDGEKHHDEEKPGHEIHIGGGDHGIYHGSDGNGYDYKKPEEEGEKHHENGTEEEKHEHGIDETHKDEETHHEGDKDHKTDYEYGSDGKDKDIYGGEEPKDYDYNYSNTEGVHPVTHTESKTTISQGKYPPGVKYPSANYPTVDINKPYPPGYQTTHQVRPHVPTIYTAGGKDSYTTSGSQFGVGGASTSYQGSFGESATNQFTTPNVRPTYHVEHGSTVYTNPTYYPSHPESTEYIVTNGMKTIYDGSSVAHTVVHGTTNGLTTPGSFNKQNTYFKHPTGQSTVVFGNGYYTNDAKKGFYTPSNVENQTNINYGQSTLSSGNGFYTNPFISTKGEGFTGIQTFYPTRPEVDNTGGVSSVPFTPGNTLNQGSFAGKTEIFTPNYLVTSTDQYYPNQAGLPTGFPTQSTNEDTGYKTNEYYDNGGRGTIRYNNGEVTTKYTEEDIKNNQSPIAIYPTEFNQESTFIPPGAEAHFTKEGFTKTGPTRTGITTAQVGGTGSYIYGSVGDKRPTSNPDQIGENAFGTVKKPESKESPNETPGYSYNRPTTHFNEAPSSVVNTFQHAGGHSIPPGPSTVVPFTNNQNVYTNSYDKDYDSFLNVGVSFDQNNTPTPLSKDTEIVESPPNPSTLKAYTDTEIIENDSIDAGKFSGYDYDRPREGFGDKITRLPQRVSTSYPKVYQKPSTVNPVAKVTYKKPISVGEEPNSEFKGYSYPTPTITFTSTPSSRIIYSTKSQIRPTIYQNEIYKNRGNVKYTTKIEDENNNGRLESTSVSSIKKYSSSYSNQQFNIDKSYTTEQPTVTTYSGYKKLSTPRYELITKSNDVGSKGKVIVKYSDLHPVLLGKLGAECTCKSDPFSNFKSSKPLLINSSKGKIDLRNYDESDVYVDLDGSQELNNSQLKPIVVAQFNGPLKSSTKSQRPSPLYLPSGKLTSRSGKSLSVPSTKTNTLSLNSNDDSNLMMSDKIDTLELNAEGGIECARPGLFRHPKFCNKFYTCHWDDWKNKFTLHTFNCPIHLTFDTEAGACNWPSKGPSCQENNLLV